MGLHCEIAPLIVHIETQQWAIQKWLKQGSVIPRQTDVHIHV